MYIGTILSLFLLPLYIIEGIRTRLSTLRLPSAIGPVSGTFKGNRNEDQEIRLLIVGDSTVAGVGVKTTDLALPYQLARALCEKSGKTVHWRAAGCNSAESTHIRDLVIPNLPEEDYTHVFFSLGFNDLKNFRSQGKWKSGFGGLLYATRAKYPNSKIYWCKMMDPGRMPALKRGLVFVLRLRRKMISELGAALCEERGGTWIEPMKGTRAEYYCHDGVHPSEEGNRAWANHVAIEIVHNEASWQENQYKVDDEQHQMHRSMEDVGPVPAESN
ncbi:SGNH/GDSL hydrolase family protein [Flexibacterium corallicola]|uniref:SGNH/GDSL hydrolase family protein n=1 Tax=Flexibacterium corallicola TaxID=3037259 RepID=UPI00286EDAAE|nr:SGNH/GDSL hydrolase family protein [Pseudovibrio sp. M1P-2-3]